MQSQTIEGFRLSPQQKRLWLLQADGFAKDRAQFAIRITGKLEEKILQAALQTVIDRHEIFRTAFYRRPGMKFPLQVITDRGKLLWNEVNLGDLSAKEQANKIEEIFLAAGGSNFTFEQEDFLVTSCLIKQSSGRQLLIISVPALCADSWTIKNLVKEISRAYVNGLNGKNFADEPVQYLQFSEWQHELIAEKSETGKGYWQQEAQSLVLTLPFESKKSSNRKNISNIYPIQIASDIVAKLDAIAPQYQATTSDFLLACWQTLTWQLTGQSKITINNVFSNREYPELHEIMGLLAKWLPIGTSLQANYKFTEVLSQVCEAVRQAEQRQGYFNWEENTATTNCQIGFEFEEWLEPYCAGDITWTLEKQYVCFEQFKLKLRGVRRAQSLALEFHYNPAIFDLASIQCLESQFQTLVASAANNPKVAVSELENLSDRERQRLIIEFNKTQTSYRQDQFIHQRFEQQVEQTPNNIAVVFEDQCLTYAELNVRANQLARYLQRLGVGPEVVVGICLERSLEVVVALLGILKAGGAYLPLDPALPPANLAFRLQDVRVSVLVTQTGILATQVAPALAIVNLDRDGKAIAQEQDTNPFSQLQLENLAYVLYTSGSTGQPKGVAIEHQQILNYLSAILDKLELPTGASFATVSTFAADLGNTAVFPALCTGGCLHIGSQQQASDPKALAAYFHRHPIDCLKIVPSHLAALLTSAAYQTILPRQCLILGGEATTWDLVEKIQQYAPNCRILNHYGPTETTVGVLTYPVDNRQTRYNTKTVPLGRAIANTQIYLLNAQLQPVPIGVPGELYVGGAGLARGYLHRPELTAEKFIAHPFADGARLYKTGDQARYLPDGNLEFLGRADRQVKIRGFRIELGEIEAVLLQHPAVLQVVVTARADCPGDLQIVAYIVPKQQAIATNELRHFLQARLPDYMLPAAFVMLKVIPLTPNGKINYSALPTPDRARPELETNFVASRTATESALAAIWAEVLGLKQLGVHNNFFALGGHSLQAIQLVAKISMAMQLECSVKLLFLHPTIAQLAKALESLQQPQELPQPLPTLEPMPAVTTATSYFQLERRSLLSLLTAKKIAPVDAAALGYININPSYFEQKGLSRDDIISNWFDRMPVVSGIIETHWGRIADIMLPRFSFELYRNQEDIVGVIIEALEIASSIGARTVSLTGLIPSATDYGRVIAKAIGNRQDLPAFSTGHATTSATVVLAIQRICAASGRNLAQERVGFIGLGSVGMSSLRLMLKYLPHPPEILLCDVYSKLDYLAEFQQELASDLGFRGDVQLVASQATVPPEIYSATLIIGATNVPDVLDIARVKPGTIIVDDSAPHCFDAKQAVERSQQQADILFTEGGVLQSPYPIHRLKYLPRAADQIMTAAEIEATFLTGNPFNITGCVFSSLLSARFEQLQPTIGTFDGKTSGQHYEILGQLGFQAAELHCRDYVLSASAIENFQQQFGNSCSEARSN